MSSPRISRARSSASSGLDGELDPARLAPPAREHLRLDDDGAAELLGRGARLFGRGREPTLGDRDPGLPEELLALVLVEIHERRRLAKTCSERQRLCDAWPVDRRTALAVALVAAIAPRGLQLGHRRSTIRTRRAAAGGGARLGRAVAGDGRCARLPRAPVLGHAERLGGGARDRERDDGRRGSSPRIRSPSGNPSASCSSRRASSTRSSSAARTATCRGLRPARTFEPALPTELARDDSWRGTVGADGALAAGRYVRVVFGPFVTEDEPPEGMPTQFFWITDHAYRLRG